MVKHKHAQDKLYLTNKERLLYGGKASSADLHKQLLQRFKRLPFGHCCLSLQPYENPVCNQNGYIFDLENIVKFIEKFKKDPISGEPATIKQYYKINLSKSKDGKYQCPIIFKEFNENSHIVCIKTTGNCYSFEAVDELNFKAKNYKDLQTDEPFTRKDVITLQEPTNIEKQNLSKFYYLEHNLKWIDIEEEDDDGRGNLKSTNQTLEATLEEMKKLENNKLSAASSSSSNNDLYEGYVHDVHKFKKAASDRFNSAIYSTGQAAASLTSTAMAPVAKLEAAYIGDDTYRYSQLNKKGYVQLKTNFGPLNFELFCKESPKACENFIKLCKSNYYDNTKFHRLIKYFIIQGGDPTGTGKGGQSFWGEPFKDEFDNSFAFDKRGYLAMANSGRNTNKSQFFITFKSCKHLNKKHTIFGRLVGGAEILDKLENIPTSEKTDRPLKDIIIENTTVFVDPYEEIDKQIEEERKKEENEKEIKCVKKTETVNGLSRNELEQCKRKVGALIDLKKLASKLKSEDNPDELKYNKKQKKIQSDFGNFSNW